jgi:low affinity Fe/Cu permease
MVTESKGASEKETAMKTNSLFFKFAKWASHKTGEPLAFGFALVVILAWILTGPAFHYSNTWQLIINTSTTVITFLMVFLIQNTQNRDMLALHLKLNELIRAVRSANNSIIEIEELSEEELRAIDEKYKEFVRQTVKQRKNKIELSDSKPPQQ